MPNKPIIDFGRNQVQTAETYAKGGRRDRSIRHALLAWYISEVMKADVVEAPDEAIATYPLA